METFGMYEEPTDMIVNVVKEGDLNINMPIPRDPVLFTDGTHMNNIPFHQFQPLADGIKVKTAIFVPKAAHYEIVKGHQWHLATEFWEAMRLIEEKM